MPRRVLVVGLGTIARTHLEVLDTIEEVTVVGGVDPVVTGLPFPVHRTLAGALAAEREPDLVVVATPTETHTTLAREIVDGTDALVLSEKPLATSLADLGTLPENVRRVRVAHHFAFSPEVEWTLRHVRTSGWGRPTRVTSIFNDAYAGLDESRLASYVSSWVDSAPNQLSLLAPFVGSLADRRPLRRAAARGHRPRPRGWTHRARLELAGRRLLQADDP